MDRLKVREAAKEISLRPMFRDRCILVYHMMHQPNAPYGHVFEAGPMGTYYGFVEAVYRNGEVVDEIPLIDVTEIIKRETGDVAQ